MRTLVILASAAVLLAVSCSDDPQSPAVDDDDEISWPAMTERDDVIRAIMLCYGNPKKAESVSKYNALLHSAFFFGLDAGDVYPGESDILDRATDIACTESIFELETLLELTITPEAGPWSEYPELDGEPCENCYVTERQYFIRAQFGSDGTIHQSPIGTAFVSIVVAPDESDPEKWVIRAMTDLVSIF